MKKIVLLLAFCLSIGNLFAQDASKLKAEGDEALKAKNYAVAFEKYDAYLKAAPEKDNVTIFNCGYCADKIKKYEDAANYFDMAIKNEYKLPSSYIGKAKAYRDMDKDAELVATLEEGMKAVPDNKTLEKMYASYYMQEGQKLQKAKKSNDAEEAYKKILTLSDKGLKTNALYSLGVLCMSDAARILSAAKPLATSDVDKYNVEKDKALVELNKAAEYLNTATTLSPDHPKVKEVIDQVAKLQEQMK